jgi:hypothetical protein
MILRVSYFLQVKVVSISRPAKDEQFSAEKLLLMI